MRHIIQGVLHALGLHAYMNEGTPVLTRNPAIAHKIDRHEVWLGFRQLLPLSLFVVVFGLALWSAWILGTWLGLYFGSAIHDPVSWGLDMVMGCFLLAMVVGGQKNPRIFAIWTVAAGAPLLAYWYLPANSHVVVGALAGGILGAFWMEQEKA